LNLRPSGYEPEHVCVSGNGCVLMEAIIPLY
jgi:hypothetical protein